MPKKTIAHGRTGGVSPWTHWVDHLEARRLFATFPVTSTADAGAGSLREAINAANSNGGTDAITFSLGSGVRTISPLSPLPDVTDPVVIDGIAPAAFPTQIVELSGANAPSGTNGLKVTAGGSTIRNLTINRFANNGIELATGGNNVIEGCRIGTDVTGATDLGNGDDGIDINNSSNNRIGGPSAAQRNVISGNNSDGVDMGSGSNGNTVLGNYIGVRASGTVALANSQNGVRVGGTNNAVGGTVAGAGNVISGNAADGVRIGGSGAAGNLIQGNVVGLNAAGSAAVANGGNGVTVLGASGNTVGGSTTAAARNVISGNAGDGVEINGGANGPGRLNVVAGNYIGTNAAGTAAIGNANDGVVVRDAPGNTIGGTTPAAANVLSGNDDDGLEIRGPLATGNVVSGNRIGTDAAGAAPLGNASDGIELEGGVGNTIGGAGSGAGNLIAANGSDGIQLWSGTGGASGSSDGNVIEGNFIGTNAAGAAGLGNADFGVVIAGGNNNAVGGTTAGAGNVITANGAGGVGVDLGTGNAIRANRIFANAATAGAGLGIDLGSDGVTPNDSLDADAGGNQLQNFPTITTATTISGGVTVQGSFHGEASRTFALDLYASSAKDPSGFGEAETYLGTATVTTDAAGNLTFNVTLPVPLTAGQFVSATATPVLGQPGSTSELCAAVAVTAQPLLPAGATASAGATWTYAGPGTTLNLTSGTITFGQDNDAENVTVVASGATSRLVFNTKNEIVNLTLTNGAKATVANSASAATRRALVVEGISVDATSTVDLGNNVMVYRYTGSGATALTQVTGLVTRGFNGGDWGGTGVTSGAAFADQTFTTALGVANNADIGYTTMGGETLTGTNEILVKYTYYGDADLSGGVDNADLLSFQDGLLPSTPNVWLSGDFDFDGQVGNSDLLAFQDGLAASRRAGTLLVADATSATPAVSRSTARPAAAPPRVPQSVVRGRTQPPTRSNSPLRVKL